MVQKVKFTKQLCNAILDNNTVLDNITINNPYQIQNFNKFAFVNPKYFDMKLSHAFYHELYYLFVVNNQLLINNMTDIERQQYKQFMQNFADMWCIDENINNCSLCYIIGDDIKYFHIGIYSYNLGYPCEIKNILIDNNMIKWMQIVQAYAKKLKSLNVT